MGLSLERECERIEAMAAKAGTPVQLRVSDSRWMRE